ncbi:MAG: hypothetical protein J0L87_10335 [Bacteroidetes bacterium]|nr:hypothetical protein [Bacteroidota bacterium]
MKKVLFICSMAIFSLAMNAQTASKPAAKAAPKVKLTSKDSLMCGKQWKVVTIEEWGVVNKPNEKTQNDMLSLNLDGTYNLILFGNKKSGTWTKTGQYIYFTDEASKEKFNYKVISVEKNKLKFDYRDPDETHSIYEMESK